MILRLGLTRSVAGDQSVNQAIKARPIGAMHARFALPVVEDVGGMGVKRNREEWEKMKKERGEGKRSWGCIVS